MARRNIEGVEIYDSIWRAGLRLGATSLTLTGTYALAANAPPLLILDPGGAARIVKLPASPKLGQMHVLINSADAAEIITVQDSAGVGLTPAATPTQNEMAILIYCGATLGWRQMVGIGV